MYFSTKLQKNHLIQEKTLHAQNHVVIWSFVIWSFSILETWLFAHYNININIYIIVRF